MKIIFIFACSGMFRGVPECSGMFHVPDFIDGQINGHAIVHIYNNIDTISSAVS